MSLSGCSLREAADLSAAERLLGCFAWKQQRLVLCAEAVGWKGI